MTEPAAIDESGDELARLIQRIPEGWSRVQIEGEPWGVTRSTRAGGGVVSIAADQLGGVGGFGANVWLTSGGAQLRPCEVPAEKVWHLLRAYPKDR